MILRRIAAAAISALEDREEQQKRILFMQIPRCRRPNEDKLVICELSIRNNALTTTSIAFSQSGTSVSVEGGRMFTSVRMRQPGRPNFGYTTAISIPRETIGSIEVAFGPVREEANMLSSFAISANKSVYSFTKVPLE